MNMINIINIQKIYDENKINLLIYWYSGSDFAFELEPDNIPVLFEELVKYIKWFNISLLAIKYLVCLLFVSLSLLLFEDEQLLLLKYW